MKKLLLLITCISSLTFGAEPTTIKFTFTEGEPVEFSLYSPEVEALKTIQFFKDMFSSAVTDTEPVDLKMTRNTFDTILTIISQRIDGRFPFSTEEMSDTVKQYVVEKLARLNMSELIDCIIAVDYLQIKPFLELAFASAQEPQRLQELITDAGALESIATLNKLPAQELERITSKIYKLVMQQVAASLENRVWRGEQFNAAITTDGSLIAIADKTKPAKTTIDLVKTKPKYLHGKRILVYNPLIDVPASVRKLTFSHDGVYLAFVKSDFGDMRIEHVEIINTITNKIVASFPLLENESIESISFSADSSRLVSCSTETLYSYDLASQTLTQKQMEVDNSMRSINNKGTQLAAFTNDGYELYDSLTLQLIHRLTYQNKKPRGGKVFSHDDKRFIYATEDGDILVWNTQTGELVRSFSLGEALISQILLSNDDSQMVASTVQRNGEIRMFTQIAWDLQTGEKRGELSRPSDKWIEMIITNCLTTDGQFLVGAEGKSLVFYQLPSFTKLEHTLKMSFNGAYTVHRAREANQFALISNDNSLISIFSLEPLVKANKNVPLLSITQRLLLMALLTSDSTITPEAQMVERLKAELATVDPTIKETIYQRFPQLRPRSSLLSRAIQWFLENPTINIWD